ncbi:MAG: 50S ribosomal protein L9 [Polyangiaceae bacterium]|nr:50S ribosomal protein L9 [Polyangiaceae bacterium]
MATHIKVVLQDDVPNLGASGDVVRVRPGFARNFLIPRILAVPATEKNLAKVEELKQKAALRAQAKLTEAQQAKAKLEGTSVKISRAVGEENKMFGSVTAHDIESAFAEVGIVVDRKKIVLPDPIRELGLRTVSVKLHSEVTANLRVEVIKAAH